MRKSNNLALKGGTAYRTKPFATWPEYGAGEEQLINQVLRSGIWSRATYTNHLNYCY